MEAQQALDPLEVRFTDPGDIKVYGDRWWLYNEGDIIRFPARRLIELEVAIGMPIVDMMNGVRMNSVIGNLAAAWVAIHLEDPVLAGSFDDFTPLLLLAQWRAAEGKGQAETEEVQPEPAMHEVPDDGYPIAGSQPPTISGQMDTVVLQSLPALD